MTAPLDGQGVSRSAWPQALAAAAAGLLHTAAFAPVEAWWLQILATAVLAGLAWQATPRRAALLGWIFGTAWLASGLWWLYISMHRYGGLPAPLAAAAVGLLAAALALYLALALALWARLARPAPGRRAGPAGVAVQVALFAALWLGAELARAQLFSGFPWLASGYAHTSGPLAGWAPWIGVYGLGALAAAMAAALAGLVRAGRGPLHKPATAVLGGALLAVAAGWVLPQDFSRSTGRLSVSLVQPNIAQDLKFDPARIDANLDALARAVETARGQLVVTPESVVPLPFAAVDPAYWQRLQRAVAGHTSGQAPVQTPGRAALVGGFLGDERAGYVNSMLGLDAASDLAAQRFYSYGKRHLLPFGEFIPPGFGWFVRAMAIPLDDQARGSHQTPMVVAGQRLRPLICYEDLFGEDIVASAVDGPDAATVWVNASNLAWFGTVMVLDQHLQFSRMRALEFQRPVVRSTNTGATAVVDHRGRVTAALPPAVAGTLEAEVEGRSGTTPYARWLHAAGLAPLWALVLAGVLLAWARRAWAGR